MADAHLAHEVAHPGWSFPGRAWSAPAPLDLPPERLVLHARARGYTEACPPAQPGQVCSKTGQVIPRGGLFPEGQQPPGTEGWTRPLALEPVFLGPLIGPDAELREHLPVAEAPKLLIDAILAAEDEEFYAHRGIDVRGLLRAAWANAQGGSYKQGASTLTMQVVKNLSQAREKTMERKAREAAAALALDAHVGKEGVLQFYLDAPYLGQDGSFSICGFRAAARHYYGVDVDGLSLSQAATLAGILPAPARYAPDRFPERARERRDLVLSRMEKRGYDVAAALKEPIEAKPHPRPGERYPSYLQAVRAFMEDKVGPGILYGAGLDVWTALDVVAQEQSDKLLPERIRYLERAVGRRGAEPMEVAGAVISSRTGHLVAVHGGTQRLATDFNRATQARRQPGSSFKPVVFAFALSQRDADGRWRFTAATSLRNSRAPFPGTDGWNPRNVGGGYTSTAALAYALTWSQNIATAALLQESGGPDALIAFARRMGFSTAGWPAELGLSLGQGEVTPLEMARFVATIIGGGRLASGWPVVQATDARGRSRLRVEGFGEEVMPPEAAAVVRDMMRAVIEQGTGGASRGGGGFPGYGGPAIGKTGTTDSEKDLWFVGGTPDYAAALWMGYDQPQRIGASASDLASPLWGWWMRALMQGLPAAEFEGGVKTTSRAICLVSGGLPNGSCPLTGAPFLPGTEPRAACPQRHERQPETEAEGEPKKEKGYEGLWKRKAREAAEAQSGGAAP